VFRKDVWAWCMYDWANSAFAVVVLTAFYPVLFKTFWDSGVDSSLNTARLGLGGTLAGIIVACLSPVLGAMADAGKAKKAFLVGCMLTGCVMTAGFFLTGQGAWIAALVLFVAANMAFSCGNLFYDSLLVDISDAKNMDFISSVGYATGYVGGGLCIVLDTILVMFWRPLGLESQEQAMLFSFLSVALWWFLFSLPIIIFVKERYGAARVSAGKVVADGLKRLASTAIKITRNRALVLFILAFWLYMDGVYTVITMSVNFGLSIGIQQKTLLATIILVQFVAFPAAIGFGYLARRIGSGNAILVGIGMYVAVCTVGFFVLHTGMQFVFLACFVAVAQGGVQALSRSYFAQCIPADDSAEYFGFLNLISRFSMILGPVVVGGVTLLCHASGISDSLSSRFGMSAITVVFITGGTLLVFSELERKRKNAAA
jgi:MFS transporter, UMF1 family